MYLEAVTVCVNYGDFLAWTIKENRHHFGYDEWNRSNWVIVTDTKDKYTKRICDYYNVRCIQTDVFYENGAIFNKANGINAGLEALMKRDWVLHLDADIYLPPSTGNILRKYPLDTKCIYGFDRFNCKSFEEFINYLSYPQLTHEDWVFTHTDIFNIGTRIVRYMDEGYIPIGFGQLWHPRSSNIMEYPNEHTTAARSDMIFSQKWLPANRRFIPDFIAIHLESENIEKMGANWNGRTTKIFGNDSLIKKYFSGNIPNETKSEAEYIEEIQKRDGYI